MSYAPEHMTCNDLIYNSCSMYDELCVLTDTDTPFCYWDCSEAENTEYYAFTRWIEETCAEKAAGSQEFLPPEGERASLCYLLRKEDPAYEQWISCVETSCQDPTVTDIYLECGALKELTP